MKGFSAFVSEEVVSFALSELEYNGADVKLKMAILRFIKAYLKDGEREEHFE